VVRALGIDPGSRVTGWGVVEQGDAGFRGLASGTIRLGATDTLAARLARLYGECLALVEAWRPVTLVLERNFVAANVQSAFRIGEVRGVVLAAAAAAHVGVAEYAPASVKLAAVGHGRADKETVGRGVTAILGLAARPAVDAADALALALCHLQQVPLRTAIEAAERSARRQGRLA
jgi:crossover junction endodeoxyribonuclease RuvC